ncbi:MAG: toll/interleukin-1 receptor domain-containing protein [Desulfobacterales bacterium]|nr:toll/interleukin-1 receptor domain-containing protein [Desulfobacterales bacterium]
MVKIFLCYAEIDKEDVEKLYEKLSEEGFVPWMEAEMLPGQIRGFEINRAIQDSDLFLACLTNNSINKEGRVHSELKDALDIHRRKVEGDIYIIPVLLENCNVPHNLKEIKPVYYYKKGGWIKLIKSIQEKIRQIVEQQKIRQFVEQEKIRQFAEQEKVQWVLVLSATIDQINKQKAEAIIEHLRNVTNDIELTLLRIESGSVIVYLESSQKGYKKIVSLFKDGRISTIQNFIVEDIVLESKFNKLKNTIIVNRIEQLNKFKKQLDSIRSGNRIPCTILEWYGIPGIGKTTLAQISIRELCHKMGVPFACIDFIPEMDGNANKYFNDKSLLITDILEGICQSEKTFLKHTTDTVSNYVKNLSTSNPVVIHFDTTEEIKPAFFMWLEKNIISPLCLSGKCIIIWTGRFPQQWQCFEVKRRVVSWKLDPLPYEETIEQVGQTDVDVYQFTFGHPLGNDIVSEVIAGFKNKEYSFGEIELINAMDSVIEEYVMRDIQPELNAACRVLSIVRQFDVLILRKILSQFVAEYYGETRMFLGVIGQLTATSLVEWDSTCKGYALDPTIRQILAKHLQLKQQKKYSEINELATNIYEEFINKAKGNRSIYILERLYHLANIAENRNEDHSQIAKMLQNELKSYLQQYYNKDIALSATDKLYQELEKDKDIEKIIGEQGFAELKKAVTNHSLTLQQSK